MSIQLPRGHVAQSSSSEQFFDSRQIQVLAITDEIFSDSGRWAITVERVADPEDPDEHYALMRVQCGDAIEGILEKQGEWHRRVLELTPGEPGAYRLLIDPN